MTQLENVEDIYTLSPMQEGMLFHTIAAPDSGVFVEQFTCSLSGRFDVTAFVQSWDQVVHRHASLRTAFVWDGVDEPLQVVRQRVEIPWQHCDWQGRSMDDVTNDFDVALASDRRQGFDLSQAPLIRMRLMRTAAESYQFLWSFHHLISDGWSTPLLLQEVWSCYEARVLGQELELPQRRPYRDYIAWLQQQDRAPEEAYWKTLLAGFTRPTELPLEHWRQNTDQETGHRMLQISLSMEVTDTLNALAREHRLTLNTLVLGAWALLLSRYSGEQDVVLGATTSGRPPSLTGVEQMIGLFINTLPLRVQVTSEDSLLAFLQRIQAQQISTRDYEHTPLVDIQRWSDIPRGHPLFESIVVFENYPLDASATTRGQDLQIEDICYREQSNYPLAVLAVPGTQLQLCFVHETRVLDETAVRRLMGQLVHLLGSFGRGGDKALSDLSILTPQEQQQVLVDWNATAADYPADMGIHQLFEEQVEKTADAVAVECDEGRLSYDELDRRANQLARYLVGRGVKTGDPVGICAYPCLEMCVAIMGVLKAGASYLPLDPTYPLYRLDHMVADSRAALLLAQECSVGYPFDGKVEHILLDRDWQAIAAEREEALHLPIDPQSLAYIIYTSGSTGQPKGVMVTHRNLVNATTARIHYYPEPISKFLLLSSFSFDSSVAGIFGTLCQGGTLRLPAPRLEQDMAGLAQCIHTSQVSHILCLPSLYQLLLEQADPEHLRSLRTVIAAGETFPPALSQQHHETLPSTTLYNEYGPTEGTVWSTVHRVTRYPVGKSVPIGRPIANAQVYLLDAAGQPVPPGAAGELYIGGHGIAKGYLNQTELTAERFVTNPFQANSNERLYRTGDLARFRGDGNIEFLGRVDQQIKIRGFRVELSEIEVALQGHPRVSEAVVIAETDAPRDGADVPSASSQAKETEDSDLLLSRLLTLGRREAEALLSELENLSEEEVEAMRA